jgi:hypothetical protein
LRRKSALPLSVEGFLSKLWSRLNEDSRMEPFGTFVKLFGGLLWNRVVPTVMRAS